MRAMLPLAAVLLLGGACGRTEKASPSTAETTDYARRLEILAEGSRNAVFLRAIRDAGLDCQEVTGSTRQADYEAKPVWSARCRGGTEWTIVVAPNGVAQVLNAGERRLLRGSSAT